MTSPHQIPSGRCLCARAVAALVAFQLSTSAHDVDPKYTLVTSQIGLAGEAVTSEGYPGQHRIMSGSACVADFNRDTYPDIYIPGFGTVPDRLFINNQDGTFSNQAAQWNIDDTHTGNGCVAGDVNNDGYIDIYVVSYGDPGIDGMSPGKCRLYINSGPDINNNFHFTESAQEAGVNSVFSIPGGMTPALGDIDLDGDLDLFVATWFPTPGGNRLFENQYMQNGSTTFVDITSESLSAPQRSDGPQGFTPHIVDITGDRYPEILLSADFETSELYVNNGVDKSGRATFRTTTNKSNINADMNAMGAAIADFNGDGLLDWFQTNIRLPDQNRGNTLYICSEIDEDGDPIFQDQALSRGVVNNGWGWGVIAGDFDNDTDQDLIATNGWPGWPNETTKFWANNGTGNFFDRTSQANLLFNITGRGIVSLDHDKDGDLDLLFIENQGPLRFFRNDMAIEDGFTNYLRVRLDTSNHPCLAPDGFGAKVYATYFGVTQVHAVHNNASFLSQSERTVHIGLGPLQQVDELRIDWADGSSTTLNNIPANQEITVQAFHPADLNHDGQFDFLDTSMFVHAYYAGTNIADFDHDGMVEDQDVFDFIDAYNNACR